MSCLSCVIAFILTVLIPAKLTYDAYKSKSNVKLWAIYWAIYTLINGLFWLAPFLSEAPFNYVFVIILVWLYHDSFRGAQLIDEVLENLIANNEAVASVINTIAEKVQFLHLFESSKPVDKVKSQ